MTIKKTNLILTALAVSLFSVSCTRSTQTDGTKEEQNGTSDDQLRKYYYSINDLPETVLIPEEDIKTRFLLTESALYSFIEVPPGTTFPIHSHDAEQVLIILEGEEHHEINGVKYIMKPGDLAVHPAGVSHGGHPGPEGFKGIDIFTPPRKSHVKLMEEQGTLPDEFGAYTK
jgi:quercetin dioxygenase-like cupin family protein